MRYLLLIIAFSILLSSCDKSSDNEVIRRIVNMTEYSLEIKIFQDDTLYYNLNPWGSVDIKGVCIGGALRHCDAGWADNANYGVIVFN
jgi:hypothetical protein